MAKVSPVTGKAGYPGTGWFITTQYVDESYFQQFGAWHTGHDLAKSRQGGEPIHAVEDGVVKWAEFAGNNGFGNLILIQHKTNLFSRYGHLAEIRVSKGQQVRAGDVIGTLGNTGRSTAPHLHFDVMRTNNALDWPNKNKARLLMEYINPTDWFNETVSFEPTDGTPIGTPAGTGILPEFLRIISASGLNVRARPSLGGKILHSLPFRTIIEVRAGARLNAEGFMWRELTSGGWIAEAFTEILPSAPSNTTPSPIVISPLPPQQPTPPQVPVTPPVTPPAAAFTVTVAPRGVHASAGGWSPTDQEIDLIRHNKPESVLIAAYEGGQAQFAIPRFRDAGIKHFIIRAAHHGAVTGNPQDFVTRTLPILKEYQAALGGSPLVVAVHNEPNVTREGWKTAWQDGTTFSHWYMQVLQAYRAELPNVKIGFPALSPGGDVQNLRMDEFRFAAGCVEAIGASDWVGVHAYFVGDGNDIDLKPDRWRQMAQGRSIIITEGGPADGIVNNGTKLANVYRRCAAVGLPVMAWLLQGAGEWREAGWVENNVRV